MTWQHDLTWLDNTTLKPDLTTCPGTMTLQYDLRIRPAYVTCQQNLTTWPDNMTGQQNWTSRPNKCDLTRLLYPLITLIRLLRKCVILWQTLCLVFHEKCPLAHTLHMFYLTTWPEKMILFITWSDIKTRLPDLIWQLDLKTWPASMPWQCDILWLIL